MARWINDTIAQQQRSPRGFGQQIRSYVEGRGVRDLRTGVEGDFAATLDGDIDPFLKAAIAQSRDNDPYAAAVPDTARS
jgi:hypothetical protein